MSIDQAGRVVLTDEKCRHCGASSHAQHPAGVVPGHWRCSGCRRWQDEEEPATHIEEA